MTENINYFVMYRLAIKCPIRSLLWMISVFYFEHLMLKVLRIELNVSTPRYTIPNKYLGSSIN